MVLNTATTVGHRRRQDFGATPPQPSRNNGTALSDFRQTTTLARATMLDVIEDFERCYRAVKSRDARFDGWFFIAVTSTGIYCRPSCPATTPKPANVRFYPTAAAAQEAGFRACRRCRPDASPGSPEWSLRADTVARAMRLIGDGLVDREGVDGLARRLGYSSRQLNRLLIAELGAGPLALARAQRAQSARVLIETTDLPFAQVAVGAGFSSIRQFNETIHHVFAAAPGDLRRRAGSRRDLPTARAATAAGTISLRLPYRAPIDLDGLFAFLAARAVPGVETFADGTYWRTLRLPHALATVELSAADAYVSCRLQLIDLRDLGPAVTRVRRLLDLDADPVAVTESLGADAVLGDLVRLQPGRRVPGSVDGAEIAARAVLGQHVSVAAARRLAARLVATVGDDHGDGRLFPTAASIAEASATELGRLGLTTGRLETLRTLTARLAEGSIDLDPGADRVETYRRLREVTGIGPWTASYIAMRALGDPDVFLAGDLGVRHALEARGHVGTTPFLERTAERWRPWRSYAVMYLWASLGDRPADPALERTA